MHAIVENDWLITAPLNLKLSSFASDSFEQRVPTANLTKEKTHIILPKEDDLPPPAWIPPVQTNNGGVLGEYSSVTKEEEILDYDSLSESEREMYSIWLNANDEPYKEILSDIEDFSEFKQRYGDHWEECLKILGGRRFAIQNHVLKGAVSWHNAHLIYFDIKCLNRNPNIVSLKYNVHPDLINEFINDKPDVRFWNQWSDKDYVFENLLGANIEALIAFFHWHFEFGVSQILHSLEIHESQALDALKRIKPLGNENEKIARKIKKIEDSILDYFRNTNNN